MPPTAPHSGYTAPLSDATTAVVAATEDSPKGEEAGQQQQYVACMHAVFALTPAHTADKFIVAHPQGTSCVLFTEDGKLLRYVGLMARSHAMDTEWVDGVHTCACALSCTSGPHTCAAGSAGTILCLLSHASWVTTVLIPKCIMEGCPSPK